MGLLSPSVLKNMPFFGAVTDAVIDRILDLATIKTLKKGAYFFKEEDVASAMYVLQSGSVAIVKRSAGCDYLLQRLQSGDCFGEMSLIDFNNRSASAIAEESCLAIEISSADLFEIYKQDLEQFTIIQMNMSREVSRRLRRLDENLFQQSLNADAASPIEKYNGPAICR